MANCRSCGAEIPEAAKFCPFCGAENAQASEAPAAPVPESFNPTPHPIPMPGQPTPMPGQPVEPAAPLYPGLTPEGQPVEPATIQHGVIPPMPSDEGSTPAPAPMPDPSGNPIPQPQAAPMPGAAPIPGSPMPGQVPYAAAGISAPNWPLVLGIVSLCLGLFVATLLGFLVSIPALIMSIVALIKGNKLLVQYAANPGTLKAARILNIISIVVNSIISVFWILAIVLLAASL